MLLYVALSIVAGGSSGAGIVATKSIEAQGITQDQADVRYSTKAEADRRDVESDKKYKEIKDTMVSEKIFDERTKAILGQIELMRQEQKEDRAAMERMLLTNR